MDVAEKYKGTYRMDFIDKRGKRMECKISYIPVRLCEFPGKALVLVAVYGFGAQPMLLLTNLDMSEKKKLCMIAAKIYLMRWRIEEYFKFKKQQFELKDLRVLSLQSIRNLNLFATLAAGYIGIINTEKEDTILCWNYWNVPSGFLIFRNLSFTRWDMPLSTSLQGHAQA